MMWEVCLVERAVGWSEGHTAAPAAGPGRSRADAPGLETADTAAPAPPRPLLMQGGVRPPISPDSQALKSLPQVWKDEGKR